MPPALVVLSEPDHAGRARPYAGVLGLAEPETLPDYVVEGSSARTPVVVPEPEPEPELGPLPDFVVEAESAPRRRRPLSESSPRTRRKRISARFRTTLIDPRHPARSSDVRHPSRRRIVPPPPPVEVKSTPKADDTRSGAAGIYFPPTTAFPAPRDDGDLDLGFRRREAPGEKAPARADRHIEAVDPAGRARRRGNGGQLDGRALEPPQRVQLSDEEAGEASDGTVEDKPDEQDVDAES